MKWKILLDIEAKSSHIPGKQHCYSNPAGFWGLPKSSDLMPASTYAERVITKCHRGMKKYILVPSRAFLVEKYTEREY